MTNVCIIATIVIYLVGMLLVGFVYSKSNEDSTDFYLGGRKMGPLVTAMSAEASDMSSWLLMGLPGLAYLTGIASPGWTAIGLAVGTWLNWLIVARRLRRYSANLDAITVPQFLSLRFHDQRNLLNALGAVIIIVFFIPYTASGFAACGKLFHSLFGVDYMIAMIVSALVIVGYTILGGFRAVTTTDLIQSVVMSIALVAVLAGLILAGILAATMSTADSQMLAAASSVSQNILQEFGHMKLTEKQSLFAARLTIICVSVVGVVLARDPDSSVFGIVSFAWAGFGGAFGAVVLCALFWKRCNWQGALAGMLCGGLMVFVWKYLISPLGGVFGIYELLPAFLFSLAACVVVSLATPAPGADIEAEFEAAK